MDEPFPTISLEDFRKKYFPDTSEQEFLEIFADDLVEDVAKGRLLQAKADELLAKVKNRRADN